MDPDWAKKVRPYRDSVSNSSLLDMRLPLQGFVYVDNCSFPTQPSSLQRDAVAARDGYRHVVISARLCLLATLKG